MDNIAFHALLIGSEWTIISFIAGAAFIIIFKKKGRSK
jgi:hypothetical protein